MKKDEGAFKAIPLSRDSETLLLHISPPIQARTPMGYHQDFLRSYEPNRTFYLNETERKELVTLGQVDTKVRPAGTYARNILNRLLIDLSWNSSRLEGNTYSLLETKRLIELGETATGTCRAFYGFPMIKHFVQFMLINFNPLAPDQSES